MAFHVGQKVRLRDKYTEVDVRPTHPRLCHGHIYTIVKVHSEGVTRPLVWLDHSPDTVYGSDWFEPAVDWEGVDRRQFLIEAFGFKSEAELEVLLSEGERGA